MFQDTVSFLWSNVFIFRNFRRYHENVCRVSQDTYTLWYVVTARHSRRAWQRYCCEINFCLKRSGRLRPDRSWLGYPWCALLHYHAHEVYINAHWCAFLLINSFNYASRVLSVWTRPWVISRVSVLNTSMWARRQLFNSKTLEHVLTSSTSQRLTSRQQDKQKRALRSSWSNSLQSLLQCTWLLVCRWFMIVYITCFTTSHHSDCIVDFIGFRVMRRPCCQSSTHTSFPALSFSALQMVDSQSFTDLVNRIDPDTHDAYRVLGKDDSTLDGGPDTWGKLQALRKQLGLVAPHPVGTCDRISAGERRKSVRA